MPYRARRRLLLRSEEHCNEPGPEADPSESDLFALDRRFQTLRSLGTEVTPAVLCGRLKQCGRWVDREWTAREFQHRQVVNGVAEDRIGRGQSYPLECNGLAWAGGYVDNLGCNKPIRDADLGGQNALLRDAEVAHALGNHPAVGRTDGPKFSAALAQCGYQIDHLWKDVLMHKFLDVLGSGGAQFLLAQAGINLHHLAADFLFAHLAGTIGAVAGVNPIAGGA